jgi:hypothetical protein
MKKAQTASSHRHACRHPGTKLGQALSSRHALSITAFRDLIEASRRFTPKIRRSINLLSKTASVVPPRRESSCSRIASEGLSTDTSVDCTNQQ